MAQKFLSEEWFSEVDRLNAEAGDINAPSTLKELKLNLAVNDSDHEVAMSMNEGKLVKGFQPDASVKMMLPAELARKIFIESDQMAAMQGFMAGQIKVEGDMSQLMALQSVQPSAEQKALLDKILAVTA